MDSAGLAGAPPARCRLLGLGLVAALIADRRPFGLAREVYEREKQTRMCGNRRGLKFKKKTKKTRDETTKR
jgi:hypothetical protein